MPLPVASNVSAGLGAQNGPPGPQGPPGLATGPAGGDLGGNYPDPSVLMVNGTSVPQAGEGDIGSVLTVDGVGSANWEPPSGGGSSSGADFAVSRRMAVPPAMQQVHRKLSVTTVINSTNAPGYTAFKDMCLVHCRNAATAGNVYNAGEYIAVVDSAASSNQVLMFDPTTWEVVAQYSVTGTGWDHICYVGHQADQSTPTSSDDFIAIGNSTSTAWKLINLKTTAVSNFTIPAGTGIASNMIGDGHGVWFIIGNDLYAVDDIFNTPDYFVIASLSGSPTRMVFDGKNFWVACTGSNQIAKVQTQGIYNDGIVTTFSTAVGPKAVAFDGVNLWVTFPNGFEFQRIDPTSGSVIRSYFLSINTAAGEIIWDGEFVWATAAGVTSTTTLSLIQALPDNDLLASTQTGSAVEGFNAPKALVSMLGTRDGPNLFVISSGDNTIKAVETQRSLNVGSLKVQGAFLSPPTVITQAGFSTPYKVRSTDRRIHVGTTSTAYTVDLPANPFIGRMISVKDKAGTAATRNITVNGNGKNIDGSSTFVISTNRQNLDLVFDGTEWANIS